MRRRHPLLRAMSPLHHREEVGDGVCGNEAAGSGSLWMKRKEKHIRQRERENIKRCVV